MEVRLPAFQLPVLEKMWLTPKKRFGTCLSKESIPAITFGEFQASAPYQKLQVPETHFGLIMPIPSWQLRKKRLMQRSRGSRSCFLQHLLYIQWVCNLTAANQWTIVEIELLATVGWKRGCQPFSCLCLKNVTQSRNEIYATCLSKESIPVISFWNSKHPIFARRKVPERRNEPVSCREAEGFGRGVVFSKICNTYSDYALSCAIWLLQTNEQLNNFPDWAF